MRKNYFLLVAIFFISTQILNAQSFTDGKITPQTAVFLSKLTAAKTNAPMMAKMRAQYHLQNETYINAFIRLAHADDADLLEKYGVKVNTRLGDLITAQININDMAQIAALPEVKSIDIAIRARRRMDKARAAANVDKVHSGEGLNSPLTGKNVVVGVVDMGIQYAHVAFYDKARKNLRVKKVWDQNKKGTPPAGYKYGTEYNTKETIAAAGQDTPDETHGTHVAGIAAGAYSTATNNYHGVAYDADLVLVSANSKDTTADNTAMIDGIKYVYDYAASVNRPAVVNLSWGVHIGPHDGTSLFDEACDRLQGAGKLLVGAAGNEGEDKFHVAKTFTGEENQELKSLVQFLQSDENTGADILTGAVDIWGEPEKNYSVKLCVFNENSLTMKYISRAFNPSLLLDTTFIFTTDQHGAKGKVYFYTEKNERNKRANTYFDVDLSSIEEGNYVGFIVAAPDGTVNAWADDWYAGLTDDGEVNSTWSKGDNNFSVGEIGGTGKRIISVGAFVTKNTYKTIDKEIVSTGWGEGTLAPFSSIGPTLDGRVKPDIAAPGSSVVSAYSGVYAYDGTDYDPDVVFRTQLTIDGTAKYYYYGAMDGTSMASPFVAGVLATWLQADKTLTPEKVRGILRKTAIKDSQTGEISETGSNRWGYGKIDAWAGAKEVLLAGAGVEKTFSENEPPCALKNSFIRNGKITVLFTALQKNVTLQLLALNGAKLREKTYTHVAAGQEESIDVSALPQGAYMLMIAGDNATRGAHKIMLAR